MSYSLEEYKTLSPVRNKVLEEHRNSTHTSKDLFLCHSWHDRQGIAAHMGSAGLEQHFHRRLVPVDRRRVVHRRHVVRTTAADAELAPILTEALDNHPKPGTSTIQVADAVMAQVNARMHLTEALANSRLPAVGISAR